jgi:hypothetical protein
MWPCEESSWIDGVVKIQPVPGCDTLKSYNGEIISSQANVLSVTNPSMGFQCHSLFHPERLLLGYPRLYLEEDICIPIFASCIKYILECPHHTARWVRIWVSTGGPCHPSRPDPQSRLAESRSAPRRGSAK